MAKTETAQRQSVSLAPRAARRVKALARSRRTSASRVIAELVETGLAAQDAEKERFFGLADRLTRSNDPDEQQLLKEELARMTFGD